MTFFRSQQQNGNKHINGGYDVNFTTEIPQELKCVICHLVLREPVQIMTCGHRFCSVCFEQFKTHTQTAAVQLLCPVDRAPITPAHVFPDRGASRTIGNMKVQCRNRGCTWTDDLRNLDAHEGTCFNVVRGILSRLDKCEETLRNKDQDFLNLRSTVTKMKNDKKVVDAEIRLLKHENEQLKSESMKKDEEMKTLLEKVDQCQKEIEVLKPLSDLKEEISSVINEVKSINTARDDTRKHIDNIEALMFAHQNLESNNEITLKWVMQEYSNMFRNEEDVFSPIFHTKMGGYSFQMVVEWTGASNEELGLFLKLHRGDTPHEFLQEFNTEFTLKIHGKNNFIFPLSSTNSLEGCC